MRTRTWSAAVAVATLAVAAATAVAVPVVDRAAMVDEVARRTAPPVDVVWIGGSEIAFRGVSLVEAVNARIDDVGPRDVVIRSVTQVAPMPADIEVAAREAASAGADALIVSANISWLTWERPYCDAADFDGAVDRYVCVLSPISEAVTERRRAELASMMATLVETGLPVYVHLISHSTTALDNPQIAELIKSGEEGLQGFDPHVDSIVFDAVIPTRALAGFAEPEAFFDMVHPTLLGAQRLAEVLTPRFDVFLRQQLGL